MNGSFGNQKGSASAGSSFVIASKRPRARCWSSSPSWAGRALLAREVGRAPAAGGCPGDAVAVGARGSGALVGVGGVGGVGAGGPAAPEGGSETCCEGGGATAPAPDATERNAIASAA